MIGHGDDRAQRGDIEVAHRSIPVMVHSTNIHFQN
jgi:hypothetical protein